MADPTITALRWRAHGLAIALAVALLGIVAWAVAGNAGWRGLLVQAWGRVSLPAVLVVLPGQALAIFICAIALWRLGPEPNLRDCFAARITRDAGNNVLLILPGLGEAVGARMLVLAGARPRAAVVVRGLDVLAETLGQVPYVVIALIVLARVWRRLGLPAMALPHFMNSFWGWTLAIGFVVLLTVGLWRWAKGPGRRIRLVRRLRAEARFLAREIRRRHGALPVATALHIVAWCISGVQIWLAGQAMGLPLGMTGAIAIESAASALRVLLFFVPGGFGAQEAGVVGAGLAFGLPPSASLALALVLRVRDALFGLALGWWPWAEWRARG